MTTSTPSPELEQFMHQLRCLVCQNQSIAESTAGFAQDMRQLVEKKFAQGESIAQIKQFMVERYGDFIIYQPPIRYDTIFLWLMPVIIFIVLLCLIIVNTRRRTYPR